MIGRLDCSTGVSGDKLLASLLDLGGRVGGFCVEDVAALARRIAPEVDITAVDVSSHGIRAVGVRVSATDQPGDRDWASIRSLLDSAGLPDRVHRRALATFSALAEAEAAVHGTTPDRVHFHEVGALDAIVDVVGTCAGVDALGIESILSTAVATGDGTVQASHGTLPVPAPATAELLTGVPTTLGPVSDGARPLGELTTPTGAALLRGLGARFDPPPPFVPVAHGYGAGTREIGSPNVCRLTLGRPYEASFEHDSVAVLECNLDHLSAEAASFAAEELLAEGALDVWQTPIVMKKGRAALALSVLVPSTQAAAWAERTIALTGTLGVRTYVLERVVTERESRTLDTPFGPIRFKFGAGRARPEADDVARIARETGRSFASLAEELSALADAEPSD